jgi:hypothetical protein
MKLDPFVQIPKWGEFLQEHAPFWGEFFKLGEFREPGRMGARECLRSERTQSLPSVGGQGARARDVLLHYARSATELNKGLGVAVKRRREAPPRILF